MSTYSSTTTYVSAYYTGDEYLGYYTTASYPKKIERPVTDWPEEE